MSSCCSLGHPSWCIQQRSHEAGSADPPGLTMINATCTRLDGKSHVWPSCYWTRPVAKRQLELKGHNYFPEKSPTSHKQHGKKHGPYPFAWSSLGWWKSFCFGKGVGRITFKHKHAKFSDRLCNIWILPNHSWLRGVDRLLILSCG